MEPSFSTRILNTKKSFIREILKVTQNPNIISFAGGLPNPISFPIPALQKSMNHVVEARGASAFQYATTEGLPELRAYIAKRYQTKHHLDVTADDILITSGSQQGLDLMGKVLLNSGDCVLIEKPGYLGTIQAFSLYEPVFKGIDLSEKGLNIAQLKENLEKYSPKILYTVPNFQNPTGLTYSQENRTAIYETIKDSSLCLIEDDPYGELRFSGENLPYISSPGLHNGVLFGSFSKIVSPAMRLGWICTKNKALMDKLITAKQASDLHTNFLCQCIIYDYLANNDLDEHISHIKELYKNQSSAMVSAIKKYFPKEVQYTVPEGGMFLWVTLPNGQSAMELFDRASKENVAFVPGEPFYTEEITASTFRLNYTNSAPEAIEEGIKRLAKALQA